MHRETFNIIEYESAHQVDFEQLHRTWFINHFHSDPEPIDEFVLTQPEKAILQHEGAILVAISDRELAGTIALKSMGGGTYELTKMAVQQAYRGKGLGRALCQAAIRKARSLGAKRIVLYTHNSLEVAIQLYVKMGFQKIPLDSNTYSPFRCDVKMELWLDVLKVIRAADSHASAISEIGRESFADAFGIFFKNQEDLHRYLDRTYDMEKLQSSLLRPNNVFLLILSHQKPIGFAKIKKQSLRSNIFGSRQTELQKIYLLKEFQSRGAGHALLQSVISSSMEWNPACIWLDVLVENQKAIDFYQKNHFAREGEHFFTIGSQTFRYDVMVRRMTIDSPPTQSKTFNHESPRKNANP
jgi:ribosomal protein S18 acetylase RimI-like enzyme